MNNKLQSIIDPKKLETLAHSVLKEAARQGADQAEVNVDANQGFSVSAHGGEVETVEYNQDRVVEITVYIGKRSGTASVSDIRPEALKAAVEAACHIAKFTDEDPASGLADKEELAFHYPRIPLEAHWDITVEDAIRLAIECEREALAYDPRIMSTEESTVLTADIFRLHANSEGFLGSFKATHHEISCVLIAKEGEEMQRDYSYTIAVEPSKLKPVVEVAHTAAKRALERLGARQLATTKAPVLFIAEEARGLLGLFAGAIQGARLYRQSSFLIDHLGKKIFPDFVHIMEHPHLPNALGSAPFDDDAVRTRENIFIADGILQSYALGVYSARKLGMKTTGNADGTHNLTITPGDKDFHGLLKAMNKGLVVTELMGQGINLVTGDYSRGAGGFWVENGEIQYPVHEITVAGNLKEIFSNFVAVGNDVDERGNIRTGSILIGEMMIAGN